MYDWQNLATKSTNTSKTRWRLSQLLKTTACRAKPWERSVSNSSLAAVAAVSVDMWQDVLQAWLPDWRLADLPPSCLLDSLETTHPWHFSLLLIPFSSKKPAWSTKWRWHVNEIASTAEYVSCVLYAPKLLRHKYELRTAQYWLSCC